jgi:transposase InsO family protein
MRCAELHVVRSVSRPQQCCDNAVAASVLASLKLELIDRRSWATRAQVRRAVFDGIEVFFNRQRLHSSLRYLTPIEYKPRSTNTKVAHAD